MAGDEENRGGLLHHPVQEPADDSGIDSDDEVQRLRAQLVDFEMLQLNESGSSDEELVQRSPKPKRAKRRQMGNLEEVERDRELLIPLLLCQRARLDDSDAMSPGSPDRSSPPLYEVELTASDEDDDGSVLELVIPLQSSRYNRVNYSPPTLAYLLASLFCNLFCCTRN